MNNKKDDFDLGAFLFIQDCLQEEREIENESNNETNNFDLLDDFEDEEDNDNN